MAVTRSIGISLIVVGVIAALCVVALARRSATHGGLDYKCLVEGPRQVSAPFMVTSEAVRVHGSFSWWPLGRACNWQRADDQGFVTANPVWTTTITFLVCAADASVNGHLIAIGNAPTRSLTAAEHQGIRG